MNKEDAPEPANETGYDGVAMPCFLLEPGRVRGPFRSGKPKRGKWDEKMV
jgi:hypothetical protein